MKASGETITVVLVEDHPTFRLGLRTRLGFEPELTVVGETGSGDEALELVERLAPDVALVDLNLTGLGGVELIRRLRVSAPGVAALVLTMHDDELIFSAVRAGARGYLLKDTDPERIVAAIRAVAAGETVFSGPVSDRLLALAAPSPAGLTRGPTFADLTDREHEIFVMVAHGLSNAAISQRLGLRPKTVRNYVSTVLTKVRARDRADLVAKAREAGYAET